MKFIITTTAKSGEQMKRTAALSMLMRYVTAWLNDDTSMAIKIEKPRQR